MKPSRLPLGVTWLLLAFFYLPIAVVVLNSFNGARFGSTFEGPTLDWYYQLFEHREIWQAVTEQDLECEQPIYMGGPVSGPRRAPVDA